MSKEEIGNTLNNYSNYLRSNTAQQDTVPKVDLSSLYNTEEFTKGFSDGSYLAGLISSLNMTGMPFECIKDVIINKMLTEANQKLSDTSKRISI